VNSELPFFIITSFFSGLLFILGFIIGERQSKELGHKFSERVLGVLKIAFRGDIENTTYSRRTENFDVNYPDSTTSSSNIDSSTSG